MPNGDSGRGNPQKSFDDEVDSWLEGLGHPIRRDIIRVFNEDGKKMSVVELGEKLEAMPGHSDSEKPLSRVLRHRHLPTMDNTGLVDFDDKTNTVEYTGSETVTEILKAIDSSRPD